MRDRVIERVLFNKFKYVYLKGSVCIFSKFVFHIKQLTTIGIIKQNILVYSIRYL